MLLALAEAPTRSLTEIARAVDLPKTTTHRVLGALARTGLVARDGEDSRYHLGPEAVSLGLAAIGGPDLRTTAIPIMLDLRDRTRETITLSLRVGWERVYIAQEESAQDVRMTVEHGRRYPLFAGASGRAILAFLPAAELDEYLSSVALTPLTSKTITDPVRLRAELGCVRELGYAASFGERDASAASVAAPIRGFRGRAIGSLSVCGPVTRFDSARADELGALAHHAAEQLSGQIHDPGAGSA